MVAPTGSEQREPTGGETPVTGRAGATSRCHGDGDDFVSDFRPCPFCYDPVVNKAPDCPGVHHGKAPPVTPGTRPFPTPFRPLGSAFRVNAGGRGHAPDPPAVGGARKSAPPPAPP
ncbi:hypothetical protein GCM10010497_01080 [Streptomyces cinereoruber]|uniref:Peptidoglycan-binding protein n=1 Tax=Streptomyces cinereoruber TaxID=67260 RepID=A0AAV4KDX1_9ACTN|nr:hypothetical protein GCM10010497_01080 [Streptomyces cinereoruber]